MTGHPEQSCPHWTRGDVARRAVRLRGSAGTVTAETVVLLPVLLVVLALAISVLVCIAAQLSCVDAARAAARVAARGEDAAAVQAAAERRAPTGATVVVRQEGDSLRVTVSADVRPFGSLLHLLPAVPVSGQALAAVEPGTP